MRFSLIRARHKSVSRFSQNQKPSLITTTGSASEIWHGGGEARAGEIESFNGVEPVQLSDPERTPGALHAPNTNAGRRRADESAIPIKSPIAYITN